MRIAIVGAGPAGSAAAITLAARGVRAVLLERTRETGDALCGGFLSWSTLAGLRRLGIEPDRLNPTRLTKVRLVRRRGRSIEAALPGDARAVSRRTLDSALMRKAYDTGAGLERGVRVRAIEDATLRLADAATLRPGTLFLASGKHDVRGLARPAEAAGTDPAIGIRVRLAVTGAVQRELGDTLELCLFDRGYAGIVVQEDGSANLCLVVRRSRLRDAGGSPTGLLDRIAEEVPAFGDRLAFRIGREEAISNVPYGWRATTGGEGVYRLGDQAGVIPSIAGEGMGIAVASGIGAAEHWLVHGRSGAGAWQEGFTERLHRPLRAAGILQKAASNPFGADLMAFAMRVGLAAALAQATRFGF
jgi:flavin-dependent dehydrogenase